MAVAGSSLIAPSTTRVDTLMPEVASGSRRLGMDDSELSALTGPADT